MRDRGTKMMADKPKGMGTGVKPVPMKLFASWEVEKTSPNCIPRLCSLTLTRLVVLKPLENDLTSVIIAVKMQSSKRVLRSNEIIVPTGGTLDTDLDLSFSLQYPHFLKRDSNKLQVMLQRRKKYKNRTILGHKTLAVGQVSMAQVLQRSVDKELHLYSDLKERTNVVAKVIMLSLSSQPVDHVTNGQRKMHSSDLDRSPDVDNDSDEEYVADYNDPEFSSNEDNSDSETMDDNRGRSRVRAQFRPTSGIRQRNIKQKFIALLKRFKVPEEALDSEADHDMADPDSTRPELDELFDELDDLSDSGPEIDTMSVMSTPKPRLRPFFGGKASTYQAELQKQDSGRSSDEVSTTNGHGMKKSDSDMNAGSSAQSLHENDSNMDVIEDPTQVEQSESTTRSPNIRIIIEPDSPTIKSQRSQSITNAFERERSTSYRERKKKNQQVLLRRHSYGSSASLPRKVLLDQLSTVLAGADDRLPDSFFLVNTSDWQGQFLAQKLQEKQLKLVCTCSNADVKAAINALVTKIQKFCNTNSKSPRLIKVGIAGGDGYINSVLRPYVDQFSAKSPDWQSYIRFLVITFGSSSIGKQIANLDSTYSAMFYDAQWKETFEKSDSPKLDTQEIINRVSKYLSSANSVINIPIAEAMVMHKGKRMDDESTQVFVPFISEVKIGSPEILNTSVDLEEGLTSSSTLSSSPPSSTNLAEKLIEKPKEHHTPPSSPQVSLSGPSLSQTAGSLMPQSASEYMYMDLQVEYWIGVSKSQGLDKEKGGKKDCNKNSLKTTFRSLFVARSQSSGEANLFSMVVVTREKKQKIMRLGKKAKEVESKSQIIDGISRLICTSKSQNYPLKVCVDGVEWTGVKFFQLSSQWQTHLKHFPVAVFTTSESTTTS